MSQTANFASLWPGNIMIDAFWIQSGSGTFGVASVTYPTPEPIVLLLVGVGLIGHAAARRKASM